jgi:hypothetical protein
MAALQTELELKWKCLAELVSGKLLQAGTSKKGTSSLKSLQVRVITRAWQAVKYFITIRLLLFILLLTKNRWKNIWINVLSRNVVQTPVKCVTFLSELNAQGWVP